LKKDLPEDPLSFHREIPFWDIRKCSGRADLSTKGSAIAEVASHGPFGNRMKHWSAVRTDIETRLTTDTSFLIRHDCIGFRNSLPSTSRADRNAGGLLALLTDNGHEDRNLFPFLYSYPRKGRTTGVLMREATGHFAGLTSCTAFRDDGDGTHLDNLLFMFSMENDFIYSYINIFLLPVKHFFNKYLKKIQYRIKSFIIVNAYPFEAILFLE
jgi:hypothetical protein